MDEASLKKMTLVDLKALAREINKKSHIRLTQRKADLIRDILLYSPNLNLAVKPNPNLAVKPNPNPAVNDRTMFPLAELGYELKEFKRLWSSIIPKRVVDKLSEADDEFVQFALIVDKRLDSVYLAYFPTIECVAEINRLPYAVKFDSKISFKKLKGILEELS